MIRVKSTNGQIHTSSLLVVLLLNIIILAMVFAGIAAILNISFLKSIGLLLLTGFAISGVESVSDTGEKLIKNLRNKCTKYTQNDEND